MNTKKVLLSSFILLILLAVPTMAQTTIDPVCNENITSAGSYVMNDSVVCGTSPSFGIHIQASDVELDCAGYGINGTNTGSMSETADNDGIRVAGSTNNVTIRNCNIDGFDDGVQFAASTGGVYDSNFTNNWWRGVYGASSTDATFSGNTIQGVANDNGIQLTTTDGMTVESNTINNVSSNNGILALGDDNVIIRHNTITSGSATGIAVLTLNLSGTVHNPDNVTVYNNTVTEYGGSMAVIGNNVNMTGNSFTCNNGASDKSINGDKAAIEAANALLTGGTSAEFTIADNTISNCNTAIDLNIVENVSISGNTFTGVTTPFQFQNITGTSTASSLTAGSSSNGVTYPSFDLTKGSAIATSTYVKNAASFLAIDSASQPGLNQSGTVSLSGVNCLSFTLYRNGGFFSSLSALLSDGGTTQIATDADVGGNCPGGECTSLSCTGGTSGTLSFDVTGFSSHGAQDGEAVPEFSTWAMIIAILGVVGTFFFRRDR